MKKFFAIFMIAFIPTVFCGCSQEKPAVPMLGVWWWDSKMSIEPYLSFAESNGVTEIYYCDSGFDDDTQNFIQSANDKGIKVYWLAGEYQWIRDPDSLYKKIENYINFQAAAQFRFEGIHLDVEPHQDPLFDEERTVLLKGLISLVHGLSVKYPDISFDYDIPFWIGDEIDFNGKTLPAYAHIIENADRTFIMSYRDTAEEIYRVAEDEAEFANSVGKTLVFGVETYSTEGDKVSFYEEGKQYMNGEIAKLRTMIPSGFGVSVHQIKTWYNLQD